jgi:hypothetical protein
MDKRTKRDLERLENLTNTERNLLKGLYGDMFGSSAASSGGKRTTGRIHPKSCLLKISI